MTTLIKWLINSKILLMLLRRTGLFWVVCSIKKFQQYHHYYWQMVVDGKFVSDFCEKANLFNNFFSLICALMQNTSILPPFLYRTNARITSFRVTKEDILLIVKTLDQKQPIRSILRKRCAENMQQIYRRRTHRSVISIKFLCNFIKITLRHGCSPVNFLHISRTPFSRNASGWLLLFRFI